MTEQCKQCQRRLVLLPDALDGQMVCKGCQSLPDFCECEPDPLLAAVRDGAWLTDEVFPPLKYAIPGIIPEGLSVLAGPPKVGKSWMVLDWLLAVSSDTGLALQSVKTGDARDVFYLALEDGHRRMQNRCWKLLGDGNPIPKRFQYLTTVTPMLLVPTVAAWLEVHEGGLVVVDTLGKVLPPALGGETPYSRDYRVMGELKSLVDEQPGCSLLLNHHDRKAVTADFVEAVSGTNGIAGAADTVLVLVRDRQNPEGILHVTGRDVIENSYGVTFGDGSWSLDGGDLESASAIAEKRKAEINLGDRSKEIIEALAEIDGPASPAEVAAAVKKMDNDTAGKYLRRLEEKGRIKKEGRGRYNLLSEVSERPKAKVSVAVSERTLKSATVRNETSSDLHFGQSDTSDGTSSDVCPHCPEPLDPALVAAGYTTHGEELSA